MPVNNSVNLTIPLLREMSAGKKSRNYYSDTTVPGLIVKRLKSGRLTFRYRYRHEGTQVEIAIGIWGKEVTLEQAREKAKGIRDQVYAQGRNPRAEAKAAEDAKADTVNRVLDLYVAEHVKPKLRSAKAIVSAFDRLVRPKIGDRPIGSLKRADMADLFRGIANDTKERPIMADRTRAYLSAAFTWWEGQADDFSNPIARGTRRTSPTKSQRKRVLTPQEIRDLCSALETANIPEAYRRCIRMLLLTGQRRSDVSKAKWMDEEISGDRWIVPGSRHKSEQDHLVPITDEVRRLLGPQRQGGYCFSTDPNFAKPIQGFGRWKSTLDDEINRRRKEEKRPSMPGWQQSRNIRRTHRTMMSDIGIAKDIGERVQGRTIRGAGVTYDRSEYAGQKREALEKVAVHIEEILKGK